MNFIGNKPINQAGLKLGKNTTDLLTLWINKHMSINLWYFYPVLKQLDSWFIINELAILFYIHDFWCSHLVYLKKQTIQTC